MMNLELMRALCGPAAPRTRAEINAAASMIGVQLVRRPMLVDYAGAVRDSELRRMRAAFEAAGVKLLDLWVDECRVLQIRIDYSEAEDG